MNSDPAAAPPADPAVNWTLLCPRCGRAAGYSDAGLYALFWDGWPACCGQSMVLQPEGERDPNREAA